MELQCQCGQILSEDDIDLNNGCNELGEEYHEYDILCPNCKSEYKGNGWGEYDKDILSEIVEEHPVLTLKMI